ncbi:MAG: tRNA preQ1(34) S-adenosylmethionine ribosyltransferase-isomerase QueA [Amylibacter sp.]|nr:tRNA preQ1(34) S-adenosylmethionine ribosyltransferase-isomerase QueA [Amylibacter sp.]
MKLSDFNFNLPESLIALRPVRPRPASRLLVAADGGIEDQRFYDLPKYLRPGDRLILNDTKVFPARLTGERRRISDQGVTLAAVEVTLLSLDAEGNWLSLAKPGRRVREGETIVFSHNLSAKVLSKNKDGNKLQFSLSGVAFDMELKRLGQMPLPPYIASKRAADSQDLDDYQTVFAKNLGAVAAPTASLHFDESLLYRLSGKGVCFSKVTLHVGAGTFLPVKTDDISEHKMHSEWGQISEVAASQIAKTKSEGGRIIPVGTTALRLLESVADQTGSITPWVGDTNIFIKPGFKFHVADGLITNFHLPKSTLMMLVSAFMGVDRMKRIYDHAINQEYRFFSYGDSSLLLPQRL